jgi:hypothetical protein
MPADSESKIRRVLSFTDFYSLSERRDLLFHVQEHRFTLPKIEKALEKLDLIFVGFELNDPRSMRKYMTLNPDEGDQVSLPLWHQFELEHHYIFEFLQIDIFDFLEQPFPKSALNYSRNFNRYCP